MSAPTADSPIDVVDEQDRPVGVVPRAAVLTSGHGFRTVHVFLFSREGALLLQRLAPTRERHPGAWGSSVAAYLHAGEGYRDAAVRRLREELGLSSRIAFLGKVQMEDEGALKFVALYRGMAESAEIREPDHIAELTYWPLGELDAATRARPTDFTPTFLNLYTWFRRTKP